MTHSESVDTSIDFINRSLELVKAQRVTGLRRALRMTYGEYKTSRVDLRDGKVDKIARGIKVLSEVQPLVIQTHEGFGFPRIRRVTDSRPVELIKPRHQRVSEDPVRKALIEAVMFETIYKYLPVVPDQLGGVPEGITSPVAIQGELGVPVGKFMPRSIPILKIADVEEGPSGHDGLILTVVDLAHAVGEGNASIVPAPPGVVDAFRLG